MRLTRGIIRPRLLITCLLLGLAAGLAVQAEALGKTRVACVGDSITKGVGADAGQDYPSQLAGLLGDGYTVGNFGASGRTLQRRGPGRPYFGGKYFARARASRPNVVVIMLGTNDGKAAVKPKVLRADLEALVEAFVKLPTKPKVFVCTPIPVVRDSYGIRADTVNKQIVPVIRQAAQEMKLPLIDCYTPLTGKDDLIPDGVHPNSKGAAVIAKVVAAAIKGQGTKGEPQATGAFPGTKSEWKGYDKYDFEVDGRKCFVVVPKRPAAGRPWLWRARFAWLGETDEKLLAGGLHVAHIDVTDLFGAPKAMKHWDAFYAVLTAKRGLSKTPAILAVSRGGLAAYNWTADNPGKVACLVGIAPVCDIKSWPGGKGLSGGHGASWKLCLDAYGMSEEQALKYDRNPVDRLEPIAKARIPILHVHSPQDEAVPYAENTKVVVERIKACGWQIETIAVEVQRDSIKGNARLEQIQKAVDKKNPKAVAGTHRRMIGKYADPAVTKFVLKHAK